MPGGRRFRIALQIVLIGLLLGGLAALAFYVDRGPGPIVYPAPMLKVEERKNITYLREGKDALGMDLYLPADAGPKEGWPVVVLIHGGPVAPGTNPKDWQAFQSWGRVLAANELAAIAFNHRFYSDGEMSNATSDVAELLKYVRGHAAELHIDPQRICLWAFSGGGPQLAFAIRENPPWLRCMVAFYALLDWRYEQFSPLAQVRGGPAAMAPMLIARMGQDSANINNSIDAFASEAAKRKLNVQVANYPQGVHGFDFAQDTEESRRIIAQAISFVKAQLLGAVTMPEAAARAVVAITNVTVIDVVGGKPNADQTVIVSDRKVMDVGATKNLKIPAGARVIDGRGKFLIPGLWDMHVHLLWDPAIDTLFPLCVANGVTGVRDMHTHFPFEQIHRWQKEIEEGNRVGPRFVYAGPILDGPQPIWPGSIPVKDAQSGRKAVRDVKANGASYVKVYERLPREAYFAIADEAKKQGIPFVGHVPGSITPAEASDAGQRSIEHLSHFLEHCNDGNILHYDPAKAAALFATFNKNHTWQCPTLIVTQTTTFGREDRFANDPRRKYFTPEILSKVGFDDSKRDWDFTLKFWTEEQKLMRDMQKAGVELLAGTDTPILRNVPGFTLHDELKCLVGAGCTPAEALRAATWNPARFLGKESEMGSVAKGKVADLVLLNADPLVEISNSTKIEAVVADGRIYDRAALDKLLADVEAAAKK